MAAAEINDNIIYQPDESPPPLVALGLGFQRIMSMLAAMAATTSIIARAGGQPDSYLSWIFFTTLAVCGLGAILQTFRFWRFGSGYPITISSGTPFIAVCITALIAGGPALLSSVIAVSALIQLALISRLSLLRRIITPTVAGTILMLLAATIISVVLGRLSDMPEGTPQAAAPIIASVTLVVVLGIRLFGSGLWQQWGPILGILTGCVLAIPFGVYDLQNVTNAPWIGIPPIVWSGFDFSLGTAFWALLPGFVIVHMAVSINSISDTVAIQQVAWRRPRATDFRVVQGAHNLTMLTNLLAALLGTLPNLIGAGNSARIVLTGVAARRVGVYAGTLLIMVAFSPKIIALVVSIPRPALVAFMLVMLAMLFVQGMSLVFRNGVDPRKAAAVGVSLWIGIGFQHQEIFPHILSGTWETLLSNGMTTGSVSIILLTLLMDATSLRRKRLKVDLNRSSLPAIDAFLSDFAAKASWDEASTNRLRSAGEETLSSMLPQDDDGAANGKQSLTIRAHRSDRKIELEFMATSDEENLEDKLAYLSEQPEIQDEREFSFRLLRHYASSVQHRKYHNIDIITVVVESSR